VRPLDAVSHRNLSTAGRDLNQNFKANTAAHIKAKWVALLFYLLINNNNLDLA